MGYPLLHVLRICSVFEPPPGVSLTAVARFDPIGGMQNHTAELTRRLDGLGVKQTVVTTRPPGAPVRERVGEGAEVVRLGWPIARWRQLYSLPAARQVVAAERVDLVHVHLGEDLAAVPLGLLAARHHDAPLVITVHCSLRHTFSPSNWRGSVLKSVGGWFEQRGVGAASAVIALTERLAAALTDYGVGRERLHVIPSGVNARLFSGPFADPIPEVARPRVMFVGRITPQKSVLDLIRAAPAIDPEARIVLVGDGPDTVAVQQLATELGVADRLSITGFVAHDLVSAYLAHADVLVLPSRYEELGSVLLEALHAGVPVVASDTGGIPSVISHEDNGLLFEVGETAALARAVNRLLWDRVLARTLARRGRAGAHRFEWSVLAPQVLDVYERVLSRSRYRIAA